MSLSIQNALRRPNRRLRPYKIQRWDSAAVSLKATKTAISVHSTQHRQNHSLLGDYVTAQPRADQAPLAVPDQGKGNQEAATSIKHVSIDQLFT
jgi:hypothetical protein